jgi:hypothetical protein
MGIDEVPHFPKTFWEQLVFPFVYKPGKGEPERYRQGGPGHPEEKTIVDRMHPAE